MSVSISTRGSPSSTSSIPQTTCEAHSHRVSCDRPTTSRTTVINDETVLVILTCLRPPVGPRDKTACPSALSRTHRRHYAAVSSVKLPTQRVVISFVSKLLMPSAQVCASGSCAPCDSTSGWFVSRRRRHREHPQLARSFILLLESALQEPRIPPAFHRHSWRREQWQRGRPFCACWAAGYSWQL